MGSRIEVVEVVSFRLEVPRLVLERLVNDLKPELPVRLERQNGRWVLSHVGQKSYLRFEPGVDSVELTDVVIHNDPAGVFFHAVLGSLMIRFHGDLEARVIFDPTDENVSESWTEVVIRRGNTSYPDLSTRAAAARLAPAAQHGGALTGSLDGRSDEGSGPPVPEETAADPEPPLTAEEEELSRILNQAESSWSEYQRLKSEREGK